MKTKSVWVSCILAALFCGATANASVIITLDQVGNNVVATGSGTIDLTDLNTAGSSVTQVGINPSSGMLGLGEPDIFNNITVNNYGFISGPGSFGSGDFTPSSTSTGSPLFLNIGVARGASIFIGVPEGYVSGAELSGTATWDDATLAALGVTPETTFTWTWGTGDHADSLTLEIALPEPAPALPVSLGVAGLGLLNTSRAVLRWRSSRRNRQA